VHEKEMEYLGKLYPRFTLSLLQTAMDWSQGEYLRTELACLLLVVYGPVK